MVSVKSSIPAAWFILLPVVAYLWTLWSAYVWMGFGANLTAQYCCHLKTKICLKGASAAVQVWVHLTTASTSTHCVSTRVRIYSSVYCHLTRGGKKNKKRPIQVIRCTRRIPYGDKAILDRQRSPKRCRPATRDAETSVLPLAQWSSVSNKCNSTSFPTSVHIFRPWRGGLRLCSCRWGENKPKQKHWGIPRSVARSACCTLRFCSGVCERVRSARCFLPPLPQPQFE